MTEISVMKELIPRFYYTGYSYCSPPTFQPFVSDRPLFPLDYSLFSMIIESDSRWNGSLLRNTHFFIRKPFSCLSLNFLGKMPEIRLRFS